MRSRVVVLAALLFALVAGTRAARADWQIRRTNGRALEEQTAQALLARPADDALARRLAGLAGKAGAAALRARFQARAEAPAAAYADVAAYATLLMALGAFDDAAAAFTRAAALRAEPAMFEGRARALARADRRPEAVQAYDEALAHARSPRERRRLLEAQVVLLDERADVERDLAIRRALAELAPRDDAALRRLADALARAGRTAEAADLLEGRLGARRGVGAFDDVLRIAELRDAAGDGARAASLLAGLIEHLPRGDEERRRLAWARAVVVARHRDALPALASALAREKGAVELSVLAEVRDELGDLEGALDAIRRADRLRPSAELGRRTVALLDRLGRDDEAVSVYEALARRDPADPRWSLELIERELRRGQRRRAGDHFDGAAARFARVPAATIRLAELAARWGEDKRALAAWERVRRIAPRDEQGILGLGETQFAAGKRALGIATWQALRTRESSAVAGHLRFAEVLLEHDLLVEAFAAVQQARAMEPKQPAVHRLLAQVLERQRQPDAAVRAWETVIELSGGPEHAADRREARARILTALARAGRSKLDQRVRALEESVRRDGSDRETALFLAEAQQRLGNQAAAIATLRGVLARDEESATRPGAPAVSPDATADVTLALVRLLRAAGQNDEAVRRLEQLAALTPARARDAHVQIADVQLARHDETLALAHAQEAARLAPGDGQALARIAAIEERAGDEARALVTYRRAFERDGNATAGFALARLLEARGDVTASATVLRTILRAATDDEVILEAGRRARDVEEYLGRMGELERDVESAWLTGSGAPVYRRVFVDVLRRLLPRLAREAPRDPAAAAERARLAQRGLRPLLELVTDADGAPERALVELLGLLGNKDAVPVLARLAAPATDAARDDRDRPPTQSAAARETQIAAVIALGRLGDERGREVLERLATTPDPALRAAAVWALGRAPGPSRAVLERALRDARPDVAGLACLGLGRAGGDSAVAPLAAIATDVERPPIVRRAALAGLALTGSRAAGPTLLALADSGDEALEKEAVRAAGAIRDRRTLPALLERALLTRDDQTVLALELWASGATLPDEAPILDGIDLDTVLAALVPRASGADTSVLWRDDPRPLGDVLVRALASPGARRRRALEALDARDDGAGLAPLVPPGAAPLPTATASAVREIGARSSGAIAKLLDDADPVTAATALRVLAKLDDARVTPARVARAAAGSPPARAAALTVARRMAATPAGARALGDAIVVELTTVRGADERLGLVEALAALGDPAVAGLEKASADRSALVRAAVARALSARPTPLARATLERLASDESPAVRRAALTRGPVLDLSPSPTTMGR